MNRAGFRITRMMLGRDIRRAGAIVFEITDIRRCAFGQDATISRSNAIFAALMLTIGGVFTIRDYARTLHGRRLTGQTAYCSDFPQPFLFIATTDE